MTCDHCGMNCTYKGEDMTFETFKQALSIDNFITIGGGEPTIHPEFEKFLMYAIAHSDSILIITNGKHTERALMIAKLADKLPDSIFWAELSQDEFHEPIDEKVIQAFKGNIRNTSDYLINAGRCDWGADDCICENLFVKPNGYIYQCGCDDSPVVGNVFNDYLELDIDAGCHKSNQWKL